MAIVECCTPMCRSWLRRAVRDRSWIRFGDQLLGFYRELTGEEAVPRAA